MCIQSSKRVVQCKSQQKKYFQIQLKQTIVAYGLGERFVNASDAALTIAQPKGTYNEHT